MTRKINNQRGFTLVEIMMVVIIIGILAVLGIPRYTKYLLESKLAEVQVSIGEIKQGEAKYFQSHNPCRYKAINGITDLETALRIELGAITNFDYSIGVFGGSSVDDSDVGYVVKAELTEDGAVEFGLDEDTRVWFVYPLEFLPSTPTAIDEEWEKGWHDEEFFGGTPIDDITAVTGEVAGVTANHDVHWVT